jgi:ABC-type multidrug transport system ATPase subunit
MNTDTNAIAVQGLGKRFGAVAAVEDVSFTVERGEIFGFMGHNGAGKTTTLRMLLGLTRPTTGPACSVTTSSLRRSTCGASRATCRPHTRSHPT